MPRTASKPIPVRAGRHAAWYAALALLLTMWIGIPWVAPLAAAAPLVLHLRARPGALPAAPLWRWTASVFCAGAAMAGLAAEPAARSTFAGGAVRSAVGAWLDGSAGAFPSLAALAASLVLFAVAAAATRGLAGSIVLAEIVLDAGVAAGAVYARAFNAFAATPIALPPWIIAAITGCVVLLPALAAPRREGPAGGAGSRLSRRTLIGAGLLLAALVLRVATAPALTRLARELTIP